MNLRPNDRVVFKGSESPVYTVLFPQEIDLDGVMTELVACTDDPADPEDFILFHEYDLVAVED